MQVPRLQGLVQGLLVDDRAAPDVDHDPAGGRAARLHRGDQDAVDPAGDADTVIETVNFAGAGGAIVYDEYLLLMDEQSPLDQRRELLRALAALVAPGQDFDRHARAFGKRPQAVQMLHLVAGQDGADDRLLQGDVGAGKTVVALEAMLIAVEAGKQAALLAPTEIEPRGSPEPSARRPTT